MVRRVHMAGIFGNVTTGRLHTSIIAAKRMKGKSLEKGSKRKFPPLICLPFLLEVFSNDLHHLYPDLFEVATLLVTVASCERTHSKVKIINNNFRVAMSPDRLEDLVQRAPYTFCVKRDGLILLSRET